MAVVRKPASFAPIEEVVDIRIDTPRCIVCDEYDGDPWEYSTVTIETALKIVLCSGCKAAIKSFKYLAKR